MRETLKFSSLCVVEYKIKYEFKKITELKTVTGTNQCYDSTTKAHFWRLILAGFQHGSTLILTGPT